MPRGNKKTNASKARALALAAKRAEAKVRARDLKSVASDEIQVRAVQIFYALTNQTGGVLPGPAVPPAVTESECGSAGLAQAPAAASPDATAATQLTDESGSEHVDGQRRSYMHVEI